jgi:hypothetical protein
MPAERGIQGETKMTKRSQYLEAYLKAAAVHRWAPGTFLAYTLKGKAKDWMRRDQRALENALVEEVKSGRVVKVRSVLGSVAYIPVEALREGEEILK